MNCAARPILIVAFAVAVVTLVLYWPNVNAEFLHWDDNAYLERVVEHRDVSWATVQWAFSTTEVYYQPLTWLSHVAVYEVCGDKPAGHHFVNILLHAANAALVALVVWLLAGTVSAIAPTERLALAAGVAFVFALHPLQVESVAWFSERKTVLCALFCLASIGAYVMAVARPVPLKNSGWWWAMIGLFFAALFSKPMAVSVPAVLLALDFFPLRRYRTVSWLRLLREKAVLLVGCAVVSLVTIHAQKAGGAVFAVGTLPLQDRGLLAMRSMIFYLWKLVWPAWLCPYYPLAGKASLTQVEYLVPTLAVLALTAMALATARRAPLVFAAWAAYLALILPVSGIIQAGAQAVADRFMYLAMVPVLCALGGGAVWIARRGKFFGRGAVAAVVGGELIYFAVRTREQLPIWQDDVSLWSNATAHYPNAGLAQYQLALAFAQKERYAEALEPAERTVQLNPNVPQNHIALGRIYLALHDEARGHFRLATGLVMDRKFADALAPAKEAVRVQPTNGAAFALLGLVHLKLHQPVPAMEALREALRLDGSLLAARYNLACALTEQKQFAEAMDVLRELLPRAPQYAGMAARDTMLAGLREHPQFGPQLRALLEARPAPTP